MSAIVTGDIHLDDKPQNEYRWRLFNWLEKNNTDELILCGDLTDSKDKHSAKLVNRFMDSLNMLKGVFEKIYIVAGNHDYINPENPFFRFLDNTPKVAFFRYTGYLSLSIGECFFIPSGFDWNNFKIRKIKTDYIFTHVTFNGAEAENGTLLPGVDPAILKDFKGMCFSGDIHVPQKIRKNIEYIGAPYHIRFGDIFEPRVLRINNSGSTENLYYPAPQKHVVLITEPKELNKAKNINKDDMVKVRCFLRREELPSWKDYKEEIRQICLNKGWLLFGPELISADSAVKHNPDTVPSLVSPNDLVKAYAKRSKVPDKFVDVGLSLLAE